MEKRSKFVEVSYTSEVTKVFEFDSYSDAEGFKDYVNKYTEGKAFYKVINMYSLGRAIMEFRGEEKTMQGNNIALEGVN